MDLREQVEALVRELGRGSVSSRYLVELVNLQLAHPEVEGILWDLLDENVRERSVRRAREHFEQYPEQAAEVRAAIEADPEGWVIPYHFGWGMKMRNWLRGTVKDSELATGNWDDYYSQAVEAALKD